MVLLGWICAAVNERLYRLEVSMRRGPVQWRHATLRVGQRERTVAGRIVDDDNFGGPQGLERDDLGEEPSDLDEIGHARLIAVENHPRRPGIFEAVDDPVAGEDAAPGAAPGMAAVTEFMDRQLEFEFRIALVPPLGGDGTAAPSRQAFRDLILNALGYDLHFGAVIKAAPEKLWKLRLSTTPPDDRHGE